MTEHPLVLGCWPSHNPKLRRRRNMAERYVYLKESEIGSGGFGKVRVAHDTTLDRDVAVKSLDPILKEFSEAEQERFKREARTLAKLSHPNIPAVYDVEYTQDAFNIYFQFIEGKNLRKIIQENGPSQISVVRQWFLQIGSALEHAHKLDIIHRDIKPENIIITPDQQTAYLVDFGIALSREDEQRLTKKGYVVGSVGYMSPEQAAGEILDARADIFSLGVTFYEVLAGKRMAPGNYEDLSSNEAIPSSIDDFVLECTEPDRDRRLASARVFLTRLAGALAQPTKPLSDVLAHGKLHELALVIEEYSPTGFKNLPAGQRILIMEKVNGVVLSENEMLDQAGERFLELLVTRGVLIDAESYREIVQPAIHWAFEKKFDMYVGRPSIRKALEAAAFTSGDGAFEVLSRELLAHLSTVNFDGKPEWYLHSMRELIQALMANPTCEDVALEFGKLLRTINKAQRARPASERFSW
jgi:serine/threonine protein kinase